jgi:hypothetical protein
MREITFSRFIDFQNYPFPFFSQEGSDIVQRELILDFPLYPFSDFSFYHFIYFCFSIIILFSRPRGLYAQEAPADAGVGATRRELTREFPLS